MVRPGGTRSAKLVTLIETAALRGAGEQKAALVERVAKRLNSVRFYWTCGVRTECAEGRGCESCLSKEATAIVDLVLGEMEEGEKHD